jgi:hypothetical protein
MYVSLTSCDRIPIGRDQQDAAVDRMVVATGADARATDAQTTTDTVATLAPIDATSPMVDAATDGTTDGATDAAGTAPCLRNDDCDAYVDYCAATCGVCRAVAANPVGRVACWPPANVSCINVCEGKVAVCLQGRCTLQ